MKRIHGSVTSVATTCVLSLVVLAALQACAAKSDVGTSNQHTSGTCGMKTTTDFFHLQTTCAGLASHTSADACASESASFLDRYSDISCSLVDPKAGDRQITEDTIRGFKVAATNYSAKTDCAKLVERAYVKSLQACTSATTPDQILLCANATDVFKEVVPADVACTIAKSPLGRPATVSLATVQALRDQAGVEAAAGGACGTVLEEAFLKTELACADLASAADAGHCRTAVDAFATANPKINCVLSGETKTKADAAALATLRAKADHDISH